MFLKKTRNNQIERISFGFLYHVCLSVEIKMKRRNKKRNERPTAAGAPINNNKRRTQALLCSTTASQYEIVSDRKKTDRQKTSEENADETKQYIGNILCVYACNKRQCRVSRQIFAAVRMQIMFLCPREIESDDDCVILCVIVVVVVIIVVVACLPRPPSRARVVEPCARFFRVYLFAGLSRVSCNCASSPMAGIVQTRKLWRRALFTRWPCR